MGDAAPQGKTGVAAIITAVTGLIAALTAMLTLFLHHSANERALRHRGPVRAHAAAADPIQRQRP